MNIEYYEDMVLYDYEPSIDTFREEVLEGLTRTPKMIPSKFFYDDRGSRLFREITTLPEYYPTRVELGILKDHLAAMAELIGPQALVIEFGSGASLKTKLLLQALWRQGSRPAAYVPIDISREQLLDSASELSTLFPDTEIWPVCADYTQDFVLPEPEQVPRRAVVFFPGSTIGNFTPEEGAAFLRHVRSIVGDGGGLLLGVDLVKDTAILEAAYNDRRGVTAEFNRNMIHRMNREFRTSIDPGSFEHLAFFSKEQSRIEMHLISCEDQTLTLGSHHVRLMKGEHIITEYSYKYSIEALRELASSAGFTVHTTWTDPANLFSVHYCEAAPLADR